MSLKVCVAQLNLAVGDMAGNAQKIIDAARLAHAQGARLVLTSELSICAYAAEDLFLRSAFIAACDAAVNRVREALADLPDLCVLVGHPVGHTVRGPSFSRVQGRNRVSALSGGRVIAQYDKRELPNYQVFDERRYFEPGQEACVFEWQGLRWGLLICEDAWFDTPVQDTQAAGADVLLVLNASPFHQHKGQERQAQMRQACFKSGLPLIYAHSVGGQDELIFDGQSFALNADARLAGQAISFAEDLWLVEIDASPKGVFLQGPMAPTPDADESLWRALVLGVRDYIGKNAFPSVILGLSGGIDSALVLAIAVDALGASRVRAFMMPSPYTAEISLIDAHDMATRLQVRCDDISIEPAFNAFKASLQPFFAGFPEDTTEENLQARVRGSLLMALSNKTGALVLTTGNKSEMATGYCTLYGDMAGGFAVIKDLFKTTVFRLARWRNAHDPFGTGAQPIPERIISRPPSAELRPDQKDEDSLPPYEVLDAILAPYIERDASPSDLLAQGFDPAQVERVSRLVQLSEYKRRQAPIGIRVSPRGFGKDWRQPITQSFRA